MVDNTELIRTDLNVEMCVVLGVTTSTPSIYILKLDTPGISYPIIFSYFDRRVRTSYLLVSLLWGWVESNNINNP